MRRACPTSKPAGARVFAGLGRILPAAACLGLLFGAAPEARAGTFVFAESNEKPALVCHPKGYDGTGGIVEVTVCIDPASPNAADMEISIQNNIKVWNALEPASPNLFFGGDNNLAFNQVDFESVALHEIGHCIGLAHPNLGTESGLSGDDLRYTKALKGPNDVYNLDAGPDGVLASSDDLRGDDVNLHWFRMSNNNPFTLATTVDESTYSNTLADLPSGHDFAAAAGRQVGTLLGFPDTEAVMYQGTFSDEAQRQLNHDDVATLRFGMSGLDRTQGTADDYVVELVYVGMTDSCDIVVAFDDTETGFAVCKVQGTFLNFPTNTHVAITQANVFFNDSFNWFFNDVELTCPFDDDLVLQSQTISSTETFEACKTITAGPDFEVTGTGDLTLRAGQTIILRAGFSVLSGGRLTAEIDSSLDL